MTYFFDNNIIFMILFLPLLFATKIHPDLIKFHEKVWTHNSFQEEDEAAAASADAATDDDIRAINRHQKIEFSNGFASEFFAEETMPWPNSEIPYTIENLKFDQTFLKEFYSALEEFHSKTCVKFRPKRKDDRYFIKIIKDEGCWSYVGLQPELAETGQEVSLGDECWRKGIIIHEFTHVLGFFHEHSRFDRDAYISLNVPNIQQNRIRQFDKRSKEKVDSFGRYDYNSILHYESTAFAVDKRNPTIIPKLINEKMNEMGQRKRLSEGDIAKINAFYNCSIPKLPSPFVPSDDKNAKRNDPISYKKYSHHKNSESSPFLNLEDFRIRTDMILPPPGFVFAFASSAKNDERDFLSFKQYPSMDETFEQKKNIQCPTREAGNCMDRLDNCYELAKSGQCEKKPGYMQIMCRRSCCNCDDKQCFDTSDPSKFNTLCAPRNHKGEACAIAASRQNALDYCPMTCGICRI